MSPTGGSLDDRRGLATETRPASIAGAFTRNAERAPENLCLRFEGEDWSYGRLRGRAGAFAAALGTWGLQPGDRVALFLGNHPDFLAAYLGTHLAGGVVVPVNKGYRRAELRRGFDDEGWFRTGDLRSVSEDGYFEISGRKKELIITGGYNVYPREIEELLEGCPGVAEVAVVGLPDPEFGEKVAAAVVRDDPALTAEEVVGFCREDLAGYKKPRRVEFVDALPRNALGKVLKHEVREKLIEAER